MPQQTPKAIAHAVQAYLEAHPEAVVLQDGKVVFELSHAGHKLTAEHDQCTLQLWSGERHLVRTIVGTTERKGALRLQTQRFGHTGTKLLELVAEVQPRTPKTREPARQAYLRLLERVLGREFGEWTPEGFRAAMDLERSFGPGYARGSLVRGNGAWAVIGVGAAESQATVDGILAPGVLWLHECRERGAGRRLYKGLRLVVPRGMAMLTLARLPWMNAAAGQWELLELDERSEELMARDPADQGNVRTRLIHHPDEAAARERFAAAIEAVRAILPPTETYRVEHRLRSTAELAFLLHGLEFARARISMAPGSFAHTLAITVGAGGAETPLDENTRPALRELVADLFRRRNPGAQARGRTLHHAGPGRRIGAFTGRAAHPRLAAVFPDANTAPSRLELRERSVAAGNDPLFRAAPERWLESVLRENLAPLTRSLAPAPHASLPATDDRYGNDPDPDTRGNRIDCVDCVDPAQPGGAPLRASASDRIIPRFDPHFVYTQVPAIAGAGDRGMLDLLGVTEDGRLAVIELKAADDLQLPLQGLDYWLRVRHHHAWTTDAATGTPTAGSDLQRHGYFKGVPLSPLPPRLYLVAPALHIHPATETILRYVSPQVEWTLLALDERWRTEVRVLWRRSGGRAPV